MAVQTVNSRTFRAEIMESEVPVVVDFFADWCGPCHQVSPLVEELSRKWDGRVRFAKVDIEESQDVAAAYRIQSIPAILLFDQGAPVAWSIGAKPGYLIERELGLVKRTGYDPDKARRAAARKAGKEAGSLLGRIFGRGRTKTPRQ